MAFRESGFSLATLSGEADPAALRRGCPVAFHLTGTGGCVRLRSMAWIQTVAPAAAEGLLKRLYAGAVKRAGKVFNVIRIQSLRPDTLRASTQLYVEVMHSAKSPLTRIQREMIATVVSRANSCHY